MRSKLLTVLSKLPSAAEKQSMTWKRDAPKFFCNNSISALSGMRKVGYAASDCKFCTAELAPATSRSVTLSVIESICLSAAALWSTIVFPFYLRSPASSYKEWLYYYNRISIKHGNGKSIPMSSQILWKHRSQLNLSHFRVKSRHSRWRVPRPSNSSRKRWESRRKPW